MRQQIGQRLDSLGVLGDLDDGDLISDVMVLAKVIDTDGDVALMIAGPDGLDWIAQRGLVSAAMLVLDQDETGEKP